MHDVGDEVVLGLGAALDDLVAEVDEELELREQQGSELLLRHVVVADGGHEVVGPLLELGQLVVGHAEALGDDREREQHAVLVHELDLAAADEAVDEALGHLADAGFERLHLRRRERPVHQPALALVVGRIGRQQDPRAAPQRAELGGQLGVLLEEGHHRSGLLAGQDRAGRHDRGERRRIACDAGRCRRSA